MTTLNPTHKIVSKLFYALISQLNQAERRGAVLALSTLLPAVEESYLKAHNDKGEPSLDFYLLCADVLTGVALALQLAEDDGLFPRDMPGFSKSGLPKTLNEAETAVERMENLLKKMVKSTPSGSH